MERDIEMLDYVMMALGELRAERRHRKEEENDVTVDLFSGYNMRWHPGNTLDIYFGTLQLGTLRLNTFNVHGRYVAMAILGIVVGHMKLMAYLKSGKED